MDYEQLLEDNKFFDPFAAGGEQFYDPTARQEAIFSRYREGKTNNEASALDRLVVEIEASFMDMHFLGMFSQMQQIAAQTQRHLCAGDEHSALQRLGSNPYVAAAFGLGNEQASHAEHEEHHEDEDEDSCLRHKSHRNRGWLMLRDK